MVDSDYWKEIIHTLVRNKTRTFLTAFGVFWGILMLTVMLGSGNGLRNAIMKDFDGYAKNSTYIWAEATGKQYGGYSSGRWWNIKLKDIEVLKSSVPGIKSIAPRLEPDDTVLNNVSRGDRISTFPIVGDFPSWFEIEPMKIVMGRFLNKKDIQEKRKVCVIGKRVYEVLFKNRENPIGKKIKIYGVYFRVIGVVKPVSSKNKEKNRTIHLSFTTFCNVFNQGDTVDYIGITAKKGIRAAYVEQETIKLLKKKHSIAPDDLQAVGHVNIEKQYIKMVKLFSGITTLTWVVGAGTLIAGVIGICNIMLLVIKERTREFGIKRALGATPNQIRMNIISESVILTFISGYGGLLFGIFLLEIISQAVKSGGAISGETPMFINPMISFEAAVISLSVLIVSGIIAGLLPAERAVSVKPVEAIRTE